VSYLKEMMSIISLGVIFQNGMFGDLLKKVSNRLELSMRSSCSPSCIAILCGPERKSRLLCHSTSPVFCRLVSDPFLTSLRPVLNRVRVSASGWQKLISMDSTGKSHFAIWRPAEVRSSDALSSSMRIRSAYEWRISTVLYRLGSEFRIHLAERFDDCRGSYSRRWWRP
jgi:hypothetical protein